MNDKNNDNFSIQIECVENMSKDKIIFYTHPSNKEFLEIMLNIMDRILNINREKENDE